VFGRPIELTDQENLTAAARQERQLRKKVVEVSGAKAD